VQVRGADLQLEGQLWSEEHQAQALKWQDHETQGQQLLIVG